MRGSGTFPSAARMWGLIWHVPKNSLTRFLIGAMVALCLMYAVVFLCLTQLRGCQGSERSLLVAAVSVKQAQVVDRLGIETESAGHAERLRAHGDGGQGC